MEKYSENELELLEIVRRFTERYKELRDQGMSVEDLDTHINNLVDEELERRYYDPNKF